MQDKMFLPIYFNIFVYCPAQPKPQLSWAELALMLINPATRPTACPETAENEENKEFPIAPMGVLAPGSAHARPGWD